MCHVSGRLVLALLALVLGCGDAAAQKDNARVATPLEGAWHGRIEGAARPDRYLEVLSILPTGAGRFGASTLFGWADGTIGIAPATLAEDGAAVVLSVTAANGTTMHLRFDGSGRAAGTYQAAGKPESPIRFTRLAERPDFDWLTGVWSAARHDQTRIFDIKRVVGTADGAVIAVGQYGIVEEADKVRQMAATVTGPAAEARIAWRTATTSAELRRVNASELAGAFETAHGAARRADPIVFRQSGAPSGLPPSAPAATAEIGDPFPNLTLKTMGGETVRLSDLRGKAVVLNFFQTWDAWGRTQSATLRGAKAKYGDKVAILTVNYGGDAQRGAAAKAQGAGVYGIEGAPILIKKLPVTWVIDGKGIIVEKTNYLAENKLIALLEKATR